MVYQMAETTIVSKEGMSHVWTAVFTAGGAGIGVWVNQTFIQSKGAIATGVGLVATIAGAAMTTRSSSVLKVSGGVVLGAGLANLALGIYDLATGAIN